MFKLSELQISLTCFVETIIVFNDYESEGGIECERITRDYRKSAEGEEFNEWLDFLKNHGNDIVVLINTMDEKETVITIIHEED